MAATTAEYLLRPSARARKQDARGRSDTACPTTDRGAAPPLLLTRGGVFGPAHDHFRFTREGTLGRVFNLPRVPGLLFIVHRLSEHLHRGSIGHDHPSTWSSGEGQGSAAHEFACAPSWYAPSVDGAVQ